MCRYRAPQMSYRDQFSSRFSLENAFPVFVPVRFSLELHGVLCGPNRALIIWSASITVVFTPQPLLSPKSGPGAEAINFTTGNRLIKSHYCAPQCARHSMPAFANKAHLWRLGTKYNCALWWMRRRNAECAGKVSGAFWPTSEMLQSFLTRPF